ncbi:Single hybrid motif [Pseudocohnilembus persalinus]|uniref:Glycine cleavage system H protein n=1 Tax=Pseudocohnilembus persalinus TaxID=266149 RepID=A0A0V0QL28_PSEPJ|nr:Single hybrid motif [Pseudocohnilembus persalinus]|eukprot:KRX02858.1 Single hybrid motif [Pseudocohnilembus persalinus]
MFKYIVKSQAIKKAFTKQLNLQQNYNFAIITRYTKDHEWIKFDDSNSQGTIGITDYAQNEMGDIVHVEFPEIGETFSKGDTFGTIESVKMAADVMMPVDGEIIGTNEAVADDTSLINKEAEKQWVIQIKVSSAKQLDDLMDSEAYEKYQKEQAH